MYTSVQFQPYGNPVSGMTRFRTPQENSLPLRKLYTNVDDWIFFPDGEDNEVSARNYLLEFWKDRNRAMKDKQKAHRMFMSPSTVIPSDLADHFNSRAVRLQLKNIKQKYDPNNVFNARTITQ